MARFNTNTATLRSARRTPNTTNLAGGEAWAQDPKMELASLVTTNMVKDQYYRSADAGLDRMRELVGAVDPVFAAKAAVYARNEDGIRSITHAVAGELAHSVKGEPWTKDFLNAVVRRPDDATEILAYYISNYGKPVPNSLKKGLGRSLGKFDAYQLGKYRGAGNDISLVDLVNICHPVPTERNAEALKALVEGTLRSTDTWETKVSAAGKSENVAEAKTEAWSELLRERKMGYFALLRNLRNIATQAPELVDLACELLVDESLIRGSLVLPFRYITAMGELGSYPKYLAALSKAVDISVANVPDFGNSLVAVDGSGSMGGGAVGNARITHKVIGSLFAAILFKKNHSDTMVFGDTAGPVHGLNPADSTLTNAQKIADTCYGHSTNFHEIFKKARKPYDTIVIFSDMQAWVSNGWGTHPGRALSSYKTRTKANPKVFCFDLTGYGSTQFPEKDIFQMSGFSDKSIGLMEGLKEDPLVLIHKIEAIEF